MSKTYANAAQGRLKERTRIPLILMTIAYCQIVRVLWRSDNIPGHSESHNYNTGTNNRHFRLSTNRRNLHMMHANITTEGQLRSRRKAAKMLVAVVAMFLICYFPVHLISVLRYATNVKQTEKMTILALLSHWLCYANSAVNPVIYNFMSGKFRREFRRSFFKCPCWFAEGAGDAGASLSALRAQQRTRDSSCGGSYRLTRLSPSQHNNNRKGDLRPRNSLSESATTRLTVNSDFDAKH